MSALSRDPGLLMVYNCLRDANESKIYFLLLALSPARPHDGEIVKLSDHWRRSDYLQHFLLTRSHPRLDFRKWKISSLVSRESSHGVRRKVNIQKMRAEHATVGSELHALWNRSLIDTQVRILRELTC